MSIKLSSGIISGIIISSVIFLILSIYLIKTPKSLTKNMQKRVVKKGGIKEQTLFQKVTTNINNFFSQKKRS